MQNSPAWAAMASLEKERSIRMTVFGKDGSRKPSMGSSGYSAVTHGGPHRQLQPKKAAMPIELILFVIVLAIAEISALMAFANSFRKRRR